jgi:hypothetical protein
MGNQTGKKALDQAQASWSQAQPSIQGGGSPEVSSGKDSELLNGQHQRSFNPIDGAKRGSVSAELNSDAARYKKGPGPV